VGAQRVDNGASPAAYGGKGVVDGVGKTPARRRAWSVGSAASSGDGETWPKVFQAGYGVG
jgi:hypothetical protein